MILNDCATAYSAIENWSCNLWIGFSSLEGLKFLNQLLRLGLCRRGTLAISGCVCYCVLRDGGGLQPGLCLDFILFDQITSFMRSFEMMRMGFGAAAAITQGSIGRTQERSFYSVVAMNECK